MGIVFGKVDVEVPAHVVVRAFPTFEIRSYPAQVAAMYVSESGSDEAFRALASYCGILSDPKQQGTPEKIAMTAPVFVDYSSKTLPDAKRPMMNSMTFLLPSKYDTVESAPKPESDNIKIVQLPERVSAVVKYSGVLDATNAAQKEAALRTALQEAGITIVAEKALVAGYNPPFTIPALRTNEVQLDIDPATIPPEQK